MPKEEVGGCDEVDLISRLDGFYLRDGEELVIRMLDIGSTPT